MVRGEEHVMEEHVAGGRHITDMGRECAWIKVSSTLRFPFLSAHKSSFFWKQMCFTGFTLA